MAVRSRRLVDLTWPEVRDAVADGAGVILPIGATEQHGHHLPLDTDALLATELALAVAGTADMLVAPAVCYGYRSRPLSGGGEGFPGTVSVSGRTLISVVEDVLGGLIRAGFRDVVVLNWHFENSNFIYEAAYLARQTAARDGAGDVRIMVMEASFAELSTEVMDLLFADVPFPGWAIEHAAVLETSLMLHLCPERVLMDRAEDDEPARHPSYEMVPPPDDFLTRTGALWKATRSTADKGKAAWAEITDRVGAAISAEFATAPDAASGTTPGTVLAAER